jgi:replicative DNA helicase
MNKLLKRVYGLILTAPKADQTKLYDALRESWNKTTFEKNLYSIIGDLLDQNKDVDVLTVTMEFKNRGLFTKENAVKVSQYASGVPSDAFLSINQTLALIDYQNNVEAAKNASQKITQLIDSENFTKDGFLKIIETATKQIETKERVNKSNPEIIFEILERHNKRKKGEKFGIDLGFITLRDSIEVEEVDVMIVGARPAMGKTAFSVQCLINTAIRQNKRVAFFSLEMSSAQIMRRIIGNLAEIDTMKIKNGECNADELDRIYMIQEMPELENIKIFEGSHNIRQIGIAVNEMVLNGGCDFIIIDYLQKILPTGNRSRYEQVTQISNGVKYLAANLKIPILALAQLSRNSAQVGKLPTLTDLKESGEIEQDASIVTFLHRPEYYGEDLTSDGNPAAGVCEFLIAKNREGNIGKHELNVNLATSKFFD